MSLKETYTRELKDNLNYTPTWLPNVKLSLGDIGVLLKHEFVYRTNIGNLGISFAAGQRGARASYSHITSDAVTRTIKVAGKAPMVGSVLTDADAGITFKFNRKNAIVFDASDCTIAAIKDQESLKKAILTSYELSQWDYDYVVVTELVSAGNTSIIISEGSEGLYELKAKAGVSPTYEAINVEGNFSIAHEAQIGFNLLAKSGVTPLFRCLGLRTNWFRKDVVNRAEVLDNDAITHPAHSSFSVEEVEYDDYRAAV